MAVRGKIETEHGVSLAAGYVRIGMLTLHGAGATAQALIYASAKAREDGKTPIETVTVPFTADLAAKAPGIYAQAYAALKATPRFANAEDV